MNDQQDQRENCASSGCSARLPTPPPPRGERCHQLSVIAIFVAAAVIAALIAISQSAAATTRQLPSGGVLTRFRGFPRATPVLGDPKATVTVTEFGDLQCPICASSPTR